MVRPLAPIPDDELDRLVLAAEAAFEAAIARAFRAAIEKLLRTAKAMTAAGIEPWVSVDDAGVVTTIWRDEVPALAAPVQAVYTQAGQAVAATLVSRAGMSAIPVGAFDVLNQHAADHLAQVRNRLVRFGDAAWADVRGQLLEGFTAGEGIEPISRRLRGVSDMSRRRARLVARTEVVSASNTGAMAGASSLPAELQPATKRWLATRDGRTRETHVAADGQVVAFADKFTVGGSKMSYPGEWGAPAAEVINCRCTVTFGDDPLPGMAEVAPVSDPVQLVPETIRRGVAPEMALESMPGPKSSVGAAARSALDNIASVHRIPDGMPKVPVRASRAQGTYGVYEYDRLRGRPMAIRVRGTGDHLEGTFTHEFGHYLDHQANLLGVERASGQLPVWGTNTVNHGNPLMLRFLRAVNDTPTYQELMRAGGSALARYYRSPVEVWARAYHQWIATRSGSDVMLRQIAEIRAKPNPLARLSQWSDDEFVPVAEALDEIFREAGLLT